MSKTIRIAAQVVAAAVAIAAAIPTGGTSLLAYGLGVSATTASLIALGVTVAAGLINALTAPKPSARSTGNPEQFVLDPNAFVPYAMGRTATAGSPNFRRTFDTADAGVNDRRAWGVILSLGAISAILGFTADQTAVTFGTDGRAIGTYAGWMWQKTQLGASPEPAALGWGDGFGTPPGWDANRKLSGLAAANWGMRFDTKGQHYQGGTPAPLWILEGVLVYDPRLDSTYPGGSGPCRALDESTYVYSDNPYLHALTWCIGRWQNGKRVMGLGAPLVGIDIPAFVEGANVAYINGWKIGGIAYSGDSKWETLKKILQAGMGEPLQLGAKISCMVNSPKVSLATITSADLKGEASCARTQARRDRINRITPSYRQEGQNWQFLPGTPIAVSDYVTFDGGQRSKAVDYPFIQSDGLGPDGTDKQIAVAVRYDIENAREFGPIVLPCGPRWRGYKPGDCLTAQIPELGLNGQDILLTNRGTAPTTGLVTLTARSETAAKHPFALGQTTTAPPTPGQSAAPVTPTPGPTAWALSGVSLDSDGTATPALRIVGAVDSAIVDEIVVEYRPFVSGQPDDEGWIGWSVLNPASTEVIITGAAPASPYEAAISYRRRGRVGNRRILGPVTAGGLSIAFDNVTGSNKPEDNATKNEPRGPYNSALAYAKGDTVTYNGSSYVAIQAVPAGAPPPDPTYWQLLAAAGSDGEPGADAPLLQVQYSTDGSSWHGTYSGSDVYLRMSADGGATWGLAQLIRGGEIAYAWVRSATTPSAPPSMPGDYPGNPGGNPASNVRPPSGWYATDPGGTDPLWMTFAHFGGDGFNYTGWNAPTQVQGVDGTPGPPGTSAIVQGSVDGSTSWHEPPTTGDQYLRVSNDGGATFGDPFRVTGEVAPPTLPSTFITSEGDTAYGTVIDLPAGKTISLVATVPIFGAGGMPTCTLVSYYTLDGSSFVEMDTDTNTIPHSETDSVYVDGGPYTNSTGDVQHVSFRVNLSHSTGTPSIQGGGYMKPFIS